MSYKQRVGGNLIKLLYTIYKLLGYSFVYFSLYIVVAYYFIFAINVRVALKYYYKTIGIKFTNKKFFRHLFLYAIATSDRFISKANPEIYSFANVNRPKLLKEVQEGSILLLNHFGGWSTASNYFNENDIKINIVMNEAMIKNASSFEDIIDKKNKQCVKIIDLSKGMISTSVTIANALLKNESVALMSDRALDKKHLHQLDFFGKKASFNKNPFLIAFKTNKPIMAIFVVFQSIKKYKLIFNKIELDKNLKQEEAINKAMKEYVVILSDILRQYPDQWFNFYNFWESK